MPWLARLRENEARQLARRLRGSALETRHLARQHLERFADEAGDLTDVAARRVAEYASHEGPPRMTAAIRTAAETRDLASQHLGQFAREAGEVAGVAAHRVADYARNEGALLADAAARRAARTAEAVKNDPLPAIAGIVGAICLASILMRGNRQSAHTR